MGTGNKSRRRIGLALGGGGARGWAHIGVLKALQQQGIEPHIVCGTSIGSLVGGAYAAGYMEMLERWVRSLERRDVLRLMDFTLGGGIVEGKKLFHFFQKHIQDTPIEDLKISYGAVATDLTSGREIWLREGSLFHAVRASISLPGFFTPVRHHDTWLVDGGLINPLPVSLCKAMGADFIIAVDLNSDDLYGPLPGDTTAVEAEEEAREITSGRTITLGEIFRKFAAKIGGKSPAKRLLQKTEGKGPGINDVITRSVAIVESVITRSRLAAEIPDIVICPEVGKIGLMDFHMGERLIEMGEAAVARVEREFRKLSST